MKENNSINEKVIGIYCRLVLLYLKQSSSVGTAPKQVDSNVKVAFLRASSTSTA